MNEYTVIISDGNDHDRGYRGTRTFWWLASWWGAYAELGLYWFLSEYYGRSAVRLLRPSQLLEHSAQYQTKWLFVGLPTSLGKEHLQRIKYKRLVLYDSSDFHGLSFRDSRKSELLSETNVCLKNWRDRRWQLECKVGLLPIKRPPINNKLSLALSRSSLKKRMGLGSDPERRYDVGFVARPTGSIATNQRLRWLAELKAQRPHLRLWGGLVGGEQMRKSFRSTEDADLLESCWLNRRKIGFREYFSGLLQSKVALAPCGYAPWTYRHLEAIYAKCIVVCNDLSQYDFLIPFPTEGMIQVPDDESVVPAIDAALALRENNPEVVSTNLQEIERWLDCGKYSRKRGDTIDRFWAQLDGV